MKWWPPKLHTKTIPGLLFCLSKTGSCPVTLPHWVCLNWCFWCQCCQLSRILGQSEVSNNRGSWPFHRQVPITVAALLPAATKLWPRLCFYSCLWFCPRGEGLPQCMLGYHPPRSRHPPGADPPRSRPHWNRPPPREQTPLPLSRLLYTVNERPVRILLECILVFQFVLVLFDNNNNPLYIINIKQILQQISLLVAPLENG